MPHTSTFNIPGLLILYFCFFHLPACSDGASTRVLPPRPMAGVWHRVEAGDTVARLARAYRVPTVDIEEINGLAPLERIDKRRKIFIPGGMAPRRAQAPASAPTTAAPATAPATQPAALATRGDRGGEGGKKKTVRFIWPVSGGKLTSRFGKRGNKIHEGIDIAAREGTAILAAASGTVIYEGSGLKGYGKLIIIRHRGGLVSVYAHNRRNLVKEGVVVKRGQVIAEVGHTGRTTGDHLHFEIRRGEKPLDPGKYVRP